MKNGYRMLYFFRGSSEGYPPPFVRLLKDQGWEVDPVPVSDDAPFYGIADVLCARRRFSSYDVVAANEYFLLWAICLRLIGTSRKPKVAATSFNQSRRLLLTGIRVVDRLLNLVWQRVSLFLVHSKAEAQLFANMHDIPLDRFIFSHWGYDLPVRGSHGASLPSGPYVSMIGRNNRDIATFCAAVERAGVAGVIITARYMLDRYSGEVPASVRILTDRPMEECLAYIEGSFAHLVLVRDAQRGAGHISAVTAMLLGKPQIFTDVGPLEDYLHDQINGIAVGLEDVEAVARAIRKLRDNPGLARKLGQSGQNLAQQFLTLEAASKRVADALCELAGETGVPATS